MPALLAILLAASSVVASRPAMALCVDCACVATTEALLRDYILDAHETTRQHVDDEFQEHEEWMTDVFFIENLLPAMMMLTEQMSAVAMLQMKVIGTFLDAKHQMETERLFRQLAAEAHKDYTPSEGLCTIGTQMRSLGAADRNADVGQLVMSERSLDRQLGNVNTNASEGALVDAQGRVDQFRRVYCDPNDNNHGLGAVCQNSPQARHNKDVNFTQTVGAPLTLDINFGDADLTNDEEDVLALASNLYANKVFQNIEPGKMENEASQMLYLSARSIVAKRAVAEQSFNAITAMKSTGQALGEEGAETLTYMQAMLADLGIPAEDVTAIFGANPSYYAQMEVLTKKIFQRPEFYVDLYDKPANVARKRVALKGISLMQKRDIFESSLRSEAILSMIAELKLMLAQDDVENRLAPRNVDTRR